MLPERQSVATGQKIEDLTMATAAKFYSVAQVLFAPNPELCGLLERMTGRQCHLMPRGVNAELFHPAKRKRREMTAIICWDLLDGSRWRRTSRCWRRCSRSWKARGIAVFDF
jgi:hypothetical protein